METGLGDVLAEGLRTQLGVDPVLLGSTSINKAQLGPPVKLIDFIEAFPYCNRIYQFSLTGEQLRRAMSFMLREDTFVDAEHCMWFQVSKGFCCDNGGPPCAQLAQGCTQPANGLLRWMDKRMP